MVDTKITGLTATTTLTDDDLLVVVDSPGGTPVTKKITAVNAKTYFTTVIPAGSSLATVQAAVNALDASFGGRVVLGPGEHDWNGTLTLRSNLTLEGYGAN